MKKVELLAPAGDRESLIAAVQNGADAIYLGGTLFNARAFAKNFDYEDLLWAVSYAHMRNVKIYVTVNTLYKDEEFESLIKYIDYLYDIQVDALIIQDIGLFYLVKERYDDFEIHMSTQASVMNKYSADYYFKNGASRVVLARENTIEEIKQISAYTDIELEVFVHGALCVSYSGQCLMSSMIGKRSGNRGQCAQPCRLEYQLKCNDLLLPSNSRFLLSPKDLMTLDKVGELIDAGVTSFKIEGRMKRPEYVSATVKAYRVAIDNYLSGKKENLNNEKTNMMKMFNRDYTSGYLFHDHYLSDGLYSGNRGIVIGKVISYNKYKKRAVIRLNDDLKQGDSILFEDVDKGRPINKMYINDKLVNCGKKDDVIEIEFDFNVIKGNVRKIIDIELIKKLQLTYNKEFKKNELDIFFRGKVNEHPSISLKFNNIEVFIESDIRCDKALKTPLTKERIAKQLSKLGDTPFVVRKCIIEIDDDIIIPIKVLNELRREAIDELVKKINNTKIHKSRKKDISLLEEEVCNGNRQIDIFVSNIEQLKVCLKYPVKTIYYPYSKDALEAITICKNKNTDIALFLPRIMKSDILDEILNSQAYKEVNKVVINDIGSFDLIKCKEVILGSGLNIFNSYTAQYLNKESLLSLEMDIKQINALKYNSKIIQVYGKIENMISEFCPISQHYFGRQVKGCNKCINGNFALVDRKQESFDIMKDDWCRIHLLNSKPLYFDKLNVLKCSNYLLHFTNESINVVEMILDDYFNYILKNFNSQYKHKFEYTKGYLQ